MHRSLLIAALWLWCASSSAQPDAGRQPTMDDPMLASYCEPGQGCHSCVLPYSHWETAAVLRLQGVQPGDVLLVSPVDGEWTVGTRRGVSTWQLGVQFGARGQEVLESCQDRPALPGAIQPLDGEWEFTRESVTFQGCPPEVQEDMGGMETVRIPLAFARPFLGALDPSMPALVQTGPNAFSALKATDITREFSTVTVTSPQRMWVGAFTSIDLADSGGNCIVSTTAVLLRVAD